MPYGASGGGEFFSQNKVIPGSYINIVSAKRANEVLSERGIAAFPMELDWGGSLIRLGVDEFKSKAPLLFGYDFDSAKLFEIREVFCNATQVIVGRLNCKGQKAGTTAGTLKVTAKYPGIRGNDIKIVIQTNVDDETKFDVLTYLGIKKVDTQTVGTGEELISNEYVDFEGTNLAPDAGTSLSGGTNSEVTGEDYAEFLDNIEKESFNTLGYSGTDDIIKGLFATFIIRIRSEGIKSQLVVHNLLKDHEGVISVRNTEKLVPWGLGAEAGVSITADNTNKIYNGEIQTIPSAFNFETEKRKGHLLFYKDGNDYRVLDDINTLVTDSEDKRQDDFSSNNIIRKLDQLAIDSAIIFNKSHLGKTSNSVRGRGFFKEDICKHRKKMADMDVIEDYSPDNISVEIGKNKRSVALREIVKVPDMMKYLYMETRVE